MDKELFWFYNPKILYEKYWVIIPSNNMSIVEKLNALTRLIITGSIILFILTQNSNIIINLIVALLLITVFYFIYMNNPKQEAVELMDKNKNEWEEYKKDDTKTLNAPINYTYDKYKNNNYKGPNKNIEIEAGYIDSNGNYKINKKESDKITDTKKIISYEENNLINDKIKKKPTVENPFMNVVFSDYLDKNNYPQSSNVYDSQIDATSQQLYNSNIFRNVADVFERENAQRNFYTVPTNIVPESQTNFANWLYKQGPTCKENTSSCTYYEEPYMTSQRY
jgi:hypothetical protein